MSGITQIGNELYTKQILITLTLERKEEQNGWEEGKKEGGGKEEREKESKNLSPLESSDKTSRQLVHNLLRD